MTYDLPNSMTVWVSEKVIRIEPAEIPIEDVVAFARHLLEKFGPSKKQGRIRWTAEQHERVALMRQDGATLQDIAKEIFGDSSKRAAISAYIGRLGLPVNEKRRLIGQKAAKQHWAKVKSHA